MEEQPDPVCRSQYLQSPNLYQKAALTNCVHAGPRPCNPNPDLAPKQSCHQPSLFQAHAHLPSEPHLQLRLHPSPVFFPISKPPSLGEGAKHPSLSGPSSHLNSEGIGHNRGSCLFSFDGPSSPCGLQSFPGSPGPPNCPPPPLHQLPSYFQFLLPSRWHPPEVGGPTFSLCLPPSLSWPQGMCSHHLWSSRDPGGAQAWGMWIPPPPQGHSPPSQCLRASVPALLSCPEDTWARTAESLELGGVGRGGLEEVNFLSGNPSLSGARGRKDSLSVCPFRPSWCWAGKAKATESGPHPHPHPESAPPPACSSRLPR